MADIVIKITKVGLTIPATTALLVYINKMVDGKEINDSILKPLMICNELPKLSIFSKKK